MQAGWGCKLGKCGGWSANSPLTPRRQNNAGSRVCAAPKSDQCAGSRGNRRSLHCASLGRDDKGCVGSAPGGLWAGKGTADPSTSLRFGPNEQKIKPIESISIFSVHFTLNLPQESQLLGMTKGAPVLHVVVCAGNKNSRSLAESCLDQSRRDGGGASLTSSAISSPGWLTSSSSSGSMCTRTSATLATCCRT